MPTPRVTPDQIAQVSGLVSQYISTQQEKYASRAIPLSAQQRAALKGFFSTEVLGGTRLLVLTGERVGDPDFYPMLRGLGFNNLPDQSTMGAITFCDVVVSREPFYDGLLFHELVHVEQYRQLGIPRFSELYVRGFLNGGSYDAIPLEINAYTLGGRFEGHCPTISRGRGGAEVGCGRQGPEGSAGDNGCRLPSHRGHSNTCIFPLRGIVGMIKKNTRNLIRVL
jgi:hypothetical protein